MNASQAISVDKTKCNNCHACISVCPVKNCIDASGDVVSIINERCIACGRCVHACKHNARSYFDDTTRFLSDAKAGVPLVVCLAPAAASVFPDIPKLVSWLRSIGIKAVFDVSFGAELCAKSYIEEAKRSKPKIRLNSSCPVIVTWCKIYKPMLLELLAPIQSPMIHTAIMIREFFPQFASCKIAAFSPCAAKRREFFVEGHIEYNVTLGEIKNYINKNNIKLSDFKDSGMDGPEAERGVAFSVPGGMHDLFLRFDPEMNSVRRIQGVTVFNYLEEVPAMLNEGFAPEWVDCLNCARGCNGGPGTANSNVPLEKVEYAVRRRENQHIKKQRANIDSLIEKYWRQELYKRKFDDKSTLVSEIKMPSDEQLNIIYSDMGKHSQEDFLNCAACGYGSCKAMAVAIFNKLNKPENCVHFLRVKAETASKIKSNFLATMSHEIRTPLNSIIGLTEIELQKINLSPGTASYLNKIITSGSSLLGIINDILDISKIETGKLELILEPYETASLINDAIQLNIIRAAEKPIEFKLEIEQNIPAKLIGDELRVKQILNNLLSNAFKYTRRGTVTLNISFESKPDNETHYLVFTIIDTGIGIREEDIKKLFSDYAQLDSKANRKIEGTGLGLAITKNLVEMMGGDITVESIYEKGSKFKAFVAQKKEGDICLSDETIDNLKQFKWMTGKRKLGENHIRVQMPYARVLVVDDVETNLDVAKGLIAAYGIKVDTATSGLDAIDIIKNEDVIYDAVFIDYMMPVMDGITTAKKIKKEIKKDYIKDLPIIALTADAIVGSREKFLENGFCDFISKPVSLVRLDEVLEKYIRNTEKEKKYFSTAQAQMPVPDETQTDAQPVFEERHYINDVNFDAMFERYGNKELIIEIIKSFVDNTPALLEKIKNITHENLDDYAIIVHGIKGTCRAISADAAASIAEEIEYSAKQGRLDYCVSQNKKFHDIINALIENLKKFIKTQNCG